MASRILPVAFATIAGVSIGVATFGPEFKEMRRKRLEEEYKRDIGAAAAAAAAASGETVLPSQRENPQAAPTVTSDESSSKLSSMLGLWAWKKKDSQDTPSSKNV